MTIIKKEPIPGTRRFRCTFESGLVRESKIVYLTAPQWKKLNALAHQHDARSSEIIGRLIDAAPLAPRV